MDPDPDTDPAIFVIDLQDAKKTNFLTVFCSLQKSHKAVRGIEVFLTIFAW
jgi:hypothetical protein